MHSFTLLLSTSFPLLLFPSLTHHPSPSSSISAHLSFVHSSDLFPHSTSSLFLFIHFSPVSPPFPPLSSVLPDFFFLKILNYPGSLCLAAPPPLSRPLISLLASSSNFLDFVPCPLSNSIAHFCLVFVIGLDFTAIKYSLEGFLKISFKKALMQRKSINNQRFCTSLGFCLSCFIVLSHGQMHTNTLTARYLIFVFRSCRNIFSRVR